MVLRTASAYARNATSKINECAKSKHEIQVQLASRAVKTEKEPFHFVLHRLSTLLSPLICTAATWKRVRDALFLSGRNIITRMSRCFVQGNALRPWRGRGDTASWKCQKKLKGMAKLENPTSFPAASFRSFVFVHFPTFSLFHRAAVLSNRSYGRWGKARRSRYFPRKSWYAAKSFTVLLITRTFASGPYRIEKFWKKIYRRLCLNADLKFIHYNGELCKACCSKVVFYAGNTANSFCLQIIDVTKHVNNMNNNIILIKIYIKCKF